MRRLYILLLCVFLMGGFSSRLISETIEAPPILQQYMAPNLPGSKDPVKIQMIAEDTTIKAGTPFWVAIHLNIDEKWHIYWKNPGETGYPTSVEWSLPEGFHASDLYWPYPEQFTTAEILGYGYEKEATLLVKITPPEQLPANTAVKIGAVVRWLTCSDIQCLPGDSEAEITLPVSLDMPKHDDKVAAAFSKARAKLPKKEWNIRAQEKDGKIVLLVNPAEKITINDGYFYPDEKNQIDAKEIDHFKINSEVSNQFSVTLSPSQHLEGGIKKIGKLKGVLVAYNKDNPAASTEAIEIDVPIESKVISTSSISGEQVSQIKYIDWEGGVELALLFAFIGGMILNLMPCVLPVISFKVLSFVKMSGQSRSVTLQHGLAFSAGVLVSFWVLAGLLLTLQAYGRL